jgi:hypothetical protein
VGKNKSKCKEIFSLFLFKLISAKLEAFVESFKESLETASGDFQKNGALFERHDFLNVFDVLKPLL